MANNISTIIPSIKTVIEETTNFFYPVDLQTVNHNEYVSLNNTIDSIKNSLRTILKTQSRIILTDIAKNTSTYNDYKTFVIHILEFIKNTLSFQNVYLQVDTYLYNIINDTQSYNTILKGIVVKSYGICSDISNNGLYDLYSYKSNINQLKRATEKLEPLELVVQTGSSCKYVKDVSNTFGSQLWLLDFLFTCSMGGVKKVLLEMSDTNNIYSYNIFKDLTTDSKLSMGRLYPILLNVSVYICSNFKENSVIIINKGIQNVECTMKSNSSGTLYFLKSNQGETAIHGISFGEITYNSQKQPNTRIQGKSVQASESFIIPKKSVGILKIPFSGGAFFEQINNEDEKNAIVFVRPEASVNEYDSVPTMMSIKDYKKMI